MNGVHPTYKSFAKQLRNAREARKLTQTELAKKLGMPPSQISHFESGKRRPSQDNFKRLVEVLNVSADYLLERTDVMFPAPKSMDNFEKAFSELSWDDQELLEDILGLLIKRREDEWADRDRRASQGLPNQKGLL